jgi:hypothetical protein
VVDHDGVTEKVKFDSFIGVSPYRYRDLFEKGRRKYSGGNAQKWNQGTRRAMVESYFPSYYKAAQGDANAQTDEHRQKTEDIPEPSPISPRPG